MKSRNYPIEGCASGKKVGEGRQISEQFANKKGFFVDRPCFYYVVFIVAVRYGTIRGFILAASFQDKSLRKNFGI